MRLVVHPGFHKTGTSSVQAQLEAARERLAPRWAVGLRADLLDAPAAARAYSEGRSPVELGLFQAALADWFESPAVAQAQGAVISCEDLCGHMPGRPGITDYSAAAALLGALVKVAKAVFGPRLDLRFHLSTRGSEDWLQSLHWQLARTGTLGETGARFRKRMAPHADLAAMARRLADAVAPWPLDTLPLEEAAALAQGPVTPLLDLMGLGTDERTAFSPQERRNARPPLHNVAQLADRFAAINAQLPDKAQATARKQAALRRFRAQAAKDEA